MERFEQDSGRPSNSIHLMSTLLAAPPSQATKQTTNRPKYQIFGERGKKSRRLMQGLIEAGAKGGIKGDAKEVLRGV